MPRTDYRFSVPHRSRLRPGRAGDLCGACRADDPAGAADRAGRARRLPEFGCGLRRLLFAPNSDALQATARLIILQNLNRWLGNQITVQTLTVSGGADGDQSVLNVLIAYTLLETQSPQLTQIQVT